MRAKSARPHLGGPLKIGPEMLNRLSRLRNLRCALVHTPVLGSPLYIRLNHW